jgi:putative Mg2+ transporter-C (MgtC) family protein
METQYITMLTRLLLAVFAGGMIGFERSFHGRAAGFRTHTLVCTASTLLILLTDQFMLAGDVSYGAEVRLDPLRTVQGIMTGIGFLGAGVILKDRATIRGLTTAASIWITAAIGIAIGFGFLIPAFSAASITLVALIVFRWIEHIFPTHQYGMLTVRFPATAGFREELLHEEIKKMKGRSTGSGYHMEDGGKLAVCQMTVHLRGQQYFRQLAETLQEMESVVDFNLTLTSR